MAYTVYKCKKCWKEYYVEYNYWYCKECIEEFLDKNILESNLIKDDTTN